MNDKPGPYQFYLMMMGKGEFIPEEHEKYYSPFLMSRYLSTDERMIKPLSFINIAKESLSPSIHFQFCSSLIRGMRNVNISYAKEGLSIAKKKDTDRDAVMLFFECGNNDCDTIMDNLTENEIQDIVKYIDKNKVGQI